MGEGGSCCERSLFLSRLNKKQEGGEEPRQRASQGAAGYKWDSAVLDSKSHKIKEGDGKHAHTDKHTHLKFNFNSLIIYILFQREGRTFFSRDLYKQAHAATQTCNNKNKSSRLAGRKSDTSQSSKVGVALPHSDPHLPAPQQPISLWLSSFNGNTKTNYITPESVF